MGDRTPPRNGNLRTGRLGRQNRRGGMRRVGPDHDHANGLEVPRVRRVTGARRNIMHALNDAAQDNNNNTHQNQHDHTVRPEDRPDYNPDNNQARGGGEDVNRRRSEPVQPELKF